MLISIKTGHRYQASHRRFIHGFKTFLSIYTLGNSNFSRNMVNSNEKSQTLYFSNKNIESTYNLTVVMPPVFEVSAFKLILKCIFANNFSLTLAQYLIFISWTNIQQNNVAILYHMSALFCTMLYIHCTMK